MPCPSYSSWFTTIIATGEGCGSWRSSLCSCLDTVLTVYTLCIVRTTGYVTVTMLWTCTSHVPLCILQMSCRCRGQTQNCPSCGSPITENRNHLAERFANKLPYPCTNQSVGCQFKALLCDMASHEAACPHRLYYCVPCRPRCRWRGRRFQVRHEKDSSSGDFHKQNVVSDRITGRCWHSSYNFISGMTKPCVISGFRRGVNEVFALQGCYAAWIDSNRRFRATSVRSSRVSRNVGTIDYAV